MGKSEQEIVKIAEELRKLSYEGIAYLNSLVDEDGIHITKCDDEE